MVEIQIVGSPVPRKATLDKPNKRSTQGTGGIKARGESNGYSMKREATTEIQSG